MTGYFMSYPKPTAQTSDPDLRTPEDIDDDEAAATRHADARLERQIDDYDDRNVFWPSKYYGDQDY